MRDVKTGYTVIRMGDGRKYDVKRHIVVRMSDDKIKRVLMNVIIGR